MLWGPMMAASTMVITPLVVLFFFAQKYFVQGIATSGLKG
jgi:multiple sugar transport system permease protein